MTESYYTPESKYLVYAYDSFYQFYYLTFRSYTKLEKGQENEFIETMLEFKKFHVDRKKKPDPYAGGELNNIMNVSNLDWDILWNRFNIQEYRGPLRDLMKQLLRFINWETFTRKVNKSNDLVLVYQYYAHYCYIHGINDKKRVEAYRKYLYETLRRMKKTPEEALCKMIEDYGNIFERGYEPNSLENTLQKSKKAVFNFLLEEADINEEVTYKGKKVILQNLLLYRILRCGDIPEWTIGEDNPNAKARLYLDDGQSNRLRVLFSKSENYTFSGEPLNSDFDEYDRATLNIMMNRINDTFNIFNDYRYRLYDDNQLNTLLETGMYTTDKAPFVDRFATIVRFLVANRNKNCRKSESYRDEFIEFIYNQRIKVISYGTLMSLRTFLDEDEFNNYVKHIVDSNIPIYFGDTLTLSDTDENSRIDAKIVNPMYAYQHNKHVIRTLENAEEADLSVTEQMVLSKIKEELSKYTSSNKLFKKQKMSS